MSIAEPIQAVHPASSKTRRAVLGNTASIFSEFHQPETNIVIWQRELSATVQQAIQRFIASHPDVKADMNVTPQNVLSHLNETFGAADQQAFSENISELVEMFSRVFQLRQIRLRLTSLEQAMCPRFHTDRVPCRLISTYLGMATEWLPHERVDRSRLGSGNKGLPDHESGLFQNADDIQQLRCGDVALLKGELWKGNSNAGLVHRSPTLPSDETRLLLRLDYID